MQMITSYHRPVGLDEALTLLNRNGVNSAVIAGGTGISTAELPADTEVVDIQAAVPATIESDGGSLVVGAMTRLQDLIDHPATPNLLAELAHREGPSTLRNASTVGGTVAAADRESELLAGLLVHEAVVTIAGPGGATTMPLAELLADRSRLKGGIITSIAVTTSGETAAARTGRTPADTSIVAAAARVVADGFRVALTGVAAAPALVDPDRLEDLDPPGDFRGTSEYRRELAKVLTQRVVNRLGGAV